LSDQESNQKRGASHIVSLDKTGRGLRKIWLDRDQGCFNVVNIKTESETAR